MNGLATMSLWAVTLLLMAIAPAPTAAQDRQLLRELQKTNVRVLEQAGPAVVAIARVRRGLPQPTVQVSPLVDIDPTTPDDPEFVPSDFGAGIIIRANNPEHPKLILTNYHVVRGGPVLGKNDPNTNSDLWITAAGGVRFQASIVAADPHSDLAALSVTECDHRDALTALSPRTYSPRKGQLAFMLGNPFAIARDGSASANWGVVGNVLRSPFRESPDFDNEFNLFETVHHFGTLMQIGTAVPLGTSGGAVLNLDGELVGITTSLAPLKGYETSAGYAVPFTPGFRRVLAELTRGYEVEYGFLGIRPLTATPRDFEGFHADKCPAGGAVALSVTPNSPAQAGGLKANDVVVAINDQPVRNTLDLMRDVALLGPQVKVRLKAWRPQEKRFVTKTVTLGKWPVRNATDLIATAFRNPEWRGIRVDYATSRAKYLRGGGTIQFENAVVVIAVDEERQGLRIQPGDFISHVADKRVHTPAEFRNAVRDLDDDPVTVRTTDDRLIEIK